MKAEYQTINVVEPKTGNNLGTLNIPSRYKDHRKFLISSLGAIQGPGMSGLDKPAPVYILTRAEG